MMNATGSFGVSASKTNFSSSSGVRRFAMNSTSAEVMGTWPQLSSQAVL